MNESILSIDSFRALDTTRIFAANVRQPHRLEYAVVEAFPKKFILNRIVGGRGDLVAVLGKLGADVMKVRDLNPAVASSPSGPTATDEALTQSRD